MTERGDFKERNPREVQQATLCFLVKTENGKTKILLAMKKRGFGKGRLNGVGGKLEDGETVEETAIRETREEIGVSVRNLQKVGLLHFYFPDEPQKKDWNQDVHAFISTDWEGIPNETEEMKPQWFDVEEIPFDAMWGDDQFWLPLVLRGKKVEGWFAFDGNEEVGAHMIKPVKDF